MYSTRPLSELLHDGINKNLIFIHTPKCGGTYVSRILSHLGIKLNITAIMTEEQMKNTCKALSPNVDSIISVFAGRVADTGIDPTKIISKSKKYIKNKKKHEILWASTREIFNIFQATKCGCRIITIPHELLNKVNLIGKNLNKYSIETVKQFYTDAKKSGFNI
jgi:transaldolase